jgi:hypothetical protein
VMDSSKERHASHLKALFSVALKDLHFFGSVEVTFWFCYELNTHFEQVATSLLSGCLTV